MPAIWLLASNSNGISSCELARALSAQQRTAWFMLHRIREAMATPTHDRLSGEVQADETYIGGKQRNKRGSIGRQQTGRKPWAHKPGGLSSWGLIERGGRVRAFTVPNVRRSTIMPRIVGHVGPGSTVYTDAALFSRTYRKATFTTSLTHAVAYVEGQVHAKSIENLWSVLKRTLGGTYIAARPWHVDAYFGRADIPLQQPQGDPRRSLRSRREDGGRKAADVPRSAR